MTHDGGVGAGTSHFLNARRGSAGGHVTISKDHPKSARKIDAAMAAVYSRMRRAVMRWLRVLVVSARGAAPWGSDN
jgi:hypothetical protein